MLLNNIDINVCINKYLNTFNILLLRKSYKKYNNFKIYEYHNIIRHIILYSKFKINKNDDYKIELIIPTTIKYINENTIETLKNNGIVNINQIKLGKQPYFKNYEDKTTHINILNNLLNIITIYYNNINSINLGLFYLYLEIEILYNFKNILIDLQHSSFNCISYNISNIYKYILNKKYKIKKYNREENYLVLYKE
tara:strand:- start:694 stop:1281 length:588 start_codon:yes stop_codon:yes gene_type:complete